MMITTGLCGSFKLECLQGIHDLRTDVLKIAVYGPTASLSPDTTAYTSTGEIAVAGYFAGGSIVTLSSGYPLLDATTRQARVRFETVTWNPITCEAYGALLYNSSKANRAIAVVGFSSLLAPVAGPLRITFPLTAPAPICFT